VGRAVARRFAQEGHAVAVLARGEVALQATVRELRAMGVPACGLRVDVADPAQMSRAASDVERELGPIDVWINNAMVTVYGRVQDLTSDEYQRVTDVTYHGYVWGTKAALSHMAPRNRGTIIQVGSSLAYRGIPLQAAYCGAKHAIRAFTDALRSELLHDGVDVHLCMVQLPAINTPQFDQALNKMDFRAQPVPPIFQPEIAADAIYYAAYHRRRELYVGASTLKTIVAQKLVPGVVDRYCAEIVWDGQLTEERRGDEESNLFRPRELDAGAHGRFDERAREHDPFTAIANRLGAGGLRALALAAPLVGIGFALGRWSGTRRSSGTPRTGPRRRLRGGYLPAAVASRA
jgi:short-subunit dehydrogenase